MKRLLRSQSDFKTTTLRNQLTSLVLYEAVTTTQAKARDLESYANHFFNQITKNDLGAKKLAHHTLFDTNAVKKCFEEVLTRYQANETTFVRVFRTSPRHGDSAKMAIVTLIKPLVVKEGPKSAANDAEKSSEAKALAEPKAIKKPAVSRKAVTKSAKEKK